MKPIYYDEVEIDRIIIPDILLIQDENHTHIFHPLKYNSRSDKYSVPFVIQIDNIDNHFVLTRDNEIILCFQCSDIIHKIINYIDGIFLNEEIYIDIPIFENVIMCKIDDTLITKHRTLFLNNKNNKNNKDNLYEKYSDNPQFNFTTMVFERNNFYVKQIDTDRSDIAEIISSYIIKILLRFDIERFPDRDSEKFYKLMPKVECVEYMSESYNFDEKYVALSLNEIEEISKSIVITI